MADLFSGVTVSGREFFGREGDPAEHLAGILTAAGAVAAFFGGNGVVQNGDNELCVPFQTDDGELPQGYEQPPPLPGEYQLIIKAAGNGVGDLEGVLIAAAFADLPDFGTEDHGIQYLHHCRGAICTVAAGTVRGAEPGVRAVNVCAAVLTAEHRPFGEHSEAVKGGGAVAANGGICQNAVIESDIHTVMVPVECHRFDGGLLRLENFRRRFHRFRHHSHHYHLHHLLLILLYLLLLFSILKSSL